MWLVSYAMSNVVVYTKWVNKSAYILRRRVDFTKHKGNINGTQLNNNIRQYWRSSSTALMQDWEETDRRQIHHNGVRNQPPLRNIIF